MPKEHFKITPASYLVLIKDEKILMSRRFNTGYEDGNYSLPAGHLDGGETFRQAMVREAKEETGIILNPDALKTVHVMHRLVKFENVGIRERIDAFIRADAWDGKIKNMEPNKCDDLRWFPLNELPQNNIPFVKYALECIQKNIFYSEYGF
jgi:8-oxo-dGTP pyrophosphatase MutT (NUDIX family)